MSVSINEIELARRNGTLERIKDRLIDEKINERYSYGDQIALLRQRDEKPEEYEAFYRFAEQCKADVREELRPAE